MGIAGIFAIVEGCGARASFAATSMMIDNQHDSFHACQSIKMFLQDRENAAASGPIMSDI